MANVSCPVPKPIYPFVAWDEYKKVKKAMPTLTDAQARHMAAANMGVSYDDFLKAWKSYKKGNLQTPVYPSASAPPPPLAYKAPPAVAKPAQAVKPPAAAAKSVKPTYVKPGTTTKVTTPDTGEHIFGKLPDGSTLTHSVARAKYKEVLKKNPGMTPATARREAAKELGISYTKYLQAWKKPTKTSAAEKEALKKFRETNPPPTTGAFQRLTDREAARKYGVSRNHPDARMVSNYTGSYYVDINRFHRGQPIFGGEDLIKVHSSAIDRVLQPVHDDIVVYRGIDGDALAKLSGLAPKDFGQLRGMVLRDPAYLSTSIERGRAFGGRVSIEIRIPGNGRTRGAYVRTVSMHSSEQEFLIARNTRLRVVSVQVETTSWGAKMTRLIVEAEG